MIQVLHVIDSLEFGGAESALYYLASYLAATYGDRCQLDVCVLYGKGYFGVRLEGEGVHVRDLALRSKYDVARLPSLARTLRQRRYDIVHTHLFPANWFGALLAPLVPETVFVTTEHSVWNRRRQWNAFRMAERLVYSQYQQVVAVSRAVRQELVRWIPAVADKVVIIPNAVALFNYGPSSARFADVGPLGDGDLNSAHRNSRPIMLFVGGLRYPKGVDIFVQALPHVMAQESCDVWIVGDGPLRQELKRQVEVLGLDQRVRFLGFREDVFELLRIADMVVLPSRWEGLPMTLLEAMAMGKPVVATSVGGIPEVIQHGQTGWLVPPEDVNALAETLTFVLRHAELARAVGQQAREIINQHYSVEVVARQTLDFYDKVLGAR